MERGRADPDAYQADEWESGRPDEAAGKAEVVEAMDGVDDIGYVGEGVCEFGDKPADDVVFFTEIYVCGRRAPEGRFWISWIGD